MRLVTLVTAVIATAACSATAQNLMQNGSFETPGPGFTEFLGWENYGNVFTADIGEVNPQDGDYTAKMFGASSGAQSDQVLLQTVEGIQAGELYTLSAYAQNRSTDPLGNENVLLIQMNFLDASDNSLEIVEVDAIDPAGDPFDTWIQSSVSGIAPAGTTQIVVAVLHIQLGADQGFPTQGGGASFWDNVTLEGGDAPCSNPADFNGDGVLNFFDISGFLQAFNQGC
ncbi:MAG: hypothetical protein WD114_01595 [Phycisphaerales bacterium]